MAARSCLCTSRLFKPLCKYPVTKPCLPTIRTASTSSLTNQLEKVESTSTINPPKLTLDPILKKKLSPSQKKAFYIQLAEAPPRDLARLFYNKLISTKYSKHLQQVFLDASAYWSVPTIKAVMNIWDDRNVQLRLDLLVKNLLQKYTITRDIASVIDCLPTKGRQTDLLPFYNAVLSHCQRKKEYEHLRLVMSVMKERNISLDAASYNVLLRITLTEDKHASALDVYHRLLEEGIVPNQATYNIFIKHAVQHKQWHMVKHWLDLMEASDLKPTQITARVVFRALSKYPLEDDLSQAFERISHAIPLIEKEKIINTSASVLIKSKQSDDAIEVIHQALESKEPLSVYTYNLLLKALCHKGKVEEAQKILESMISRKRQIPKADIVSFTTVIQGLIRQSDKPNFKEIYSLYRQLGKQGLHTNNVLQSVILYGLLKSGDVEKSKTLFDIVIKNKTQAHIPQQSGDASLSEITIYNMMIDFYFLQYHKSKELTTTTPQQSFDLLNEAIVDKQLKPTISTLNTMVRGLAILNKDLNAAEKVVELLKRKGVEVDERTIWYLAKAAYRHNQLPRARQWIQYYENLGHTIKGSGLLALKNKIM